MARAKPRNSSATTPLLRSAASIAPGHSRRLLGIRQARQQLLGLRLSEIAPLEQMLQRVTQGLTLPSLRSSQRKLRIRRGPSGVSTLSGWNCTPSTSARDGERP